MTANYSVAITNEATGETRTFVPNFGDNWTDGMEYLWSEGNFGCDCNRSLFFGRAVDTPEDQIDEAPCGQEQFRIAVSVGNRVVYEESKEAKP